MTEWFFIVKGSPKGLGRLLSSKEAQQSIQSNVKQLISNKYWQRKEKKNLCVKTYHLRVPMGHQSTEYDQ